MASALRLTFLTTVAAAAAAAQSGSPALMTPLANPDPRLAAIHAAGNTTRSIGSVAISPDGTLVAYTVGRGAAGRGAGEAAGSPIVLAPVAAHEQSQEKLISGSDSTHCSNSAPVFSPDSQTLAYTSTCTSKDDKPGDPQLFLYSRATGTSKQLSHLKGIFQHVTYSPDGKFLSFLFVDNATRSAGALAAMKPWSGVIGEDGVEIQRVAVMPIAAGSPGTADFLTPANLHVYEFAWSPVAPEITFIAANPPGENNWWVAKLYTQAHTAAPRVVFDPNTTKTALHGMQIAVPPLLPRRQAHRLRRRPYVRPGLHRRRRLGRRRQARFSASRTHRRHSRHRRHAHLGSLAQRPRDRLRRRPSRPHAAQRRRRRQAHGHARRRRRPR